MFWQAQCHLFTVVAAAGSKIGRERSLRGSPWERTRYLSQACTGPETSFFVHLEYVLRSPAEPALATGRFRPVAAGQILDNKAFNVELTGAARLYRAASSDEGSGVERHVRFLLIEAITIARNSECYRNELD